MNQVRRVTSAFTHILNAIRESNFEGIVVSITKRPKNLVSKLFKCEICRVNTYSDVYSDENEIITYCTYCKSETHQIKV